MILLKTDRLVIRDHCEGDLLPMHQLLSDPTAMYYLQDIMTHTLEETQANLRAAMEQISMENRTKYFLKIEYRGEYVGEIGYTVRLDTPKGRIVNLGYFIRPVFWGQGITTEAAREVLRFGFENLNIIKVETGCIKENVGSEKVMKKLGMIQEADYMLYAYHDQSLKDRVEYRLLREEWLAVKGAL